MATELTILGWSVLLLAAHIAVQGQATTSERGLAWNAGARDGEQPPLGVLAGRAQRALDNYKETWPAFIALALGLAVTGRSGGIAETGAWLWFGARVMYLPLYLFGVPYVRTAAFMASLVGLGMMLVRFL